MIDPKKALASRDGSDQEESIQGELLLVETFASFEETPDHLALSTQVRDWPREVLLLLPGVVAFYFGPHTHLSGLWIVLWFALLWPTLGLAMVWSPFRRRRKKGWLETVQDTLYASLSSLQGVVTGILFAFPLVVLLENGLRWMGLPYRVVSEVLLVLAIPFLGSILVQEAAASLSEKEVESLPEADLPPPEVLVRLQKKWSLSEQGLVVARTLVRSGALLLLAIAPNLLLGRELFPSGARSGNHFLLFFWTWMGTGVAFQHAMRSFFYLALGRSLPGLIEDRQEEILRLTQAPDSENPKEALPSTRVELRQRVRQELTHPLILAGVSLSSLGVGWLNLGAHRLPQMFPLVACSAALAVAWKVWVDSRFQTRPSPLSLLRTASLAAVMPALLFGAMVTLKSVRSAVGWKAFMAVSAFFPLCIALYAERVAAWISGNLTKAPSTWLPDRDKVRPALMAGGAMFLLAMLAEPLIFYFHIPWDTTLRELLRALFPAAVWAYVQVVFLAHLSYAKLEAPRLEARAPEPLGLEADPARESAS